MRTIEVVLGLDERAVGVFENLKRNNAKVDGVIKSVGVRTSPLVRVAQETNMLRQERAFLELERMCGLIDAFGVATGVKNVLLEYRHRYLTSNNDYELESEEKRDHNAHHYRRVSKSAEVVAGISDEFIWDRDYDPYLILAKVFADTHDFTQLHSSEKDGHEKTAILYTTAVLCLTRDQLHSDMPQLEKKYKQDVIALGQFDLDKISDPIGRNFFITQREMDVISKYGAAMAGDRIMSREENVEFTNATRKFIRVLSALSYIEKRHILGDQESDALNTVLRALKYSHYVQTKLTLTDQFIYDLAVLINYHSEPEVTLKKEKSQNVIEPMDDFLIQPRGVNLDLIDLGSIFDEAVFAAKTIKINKEARRKGLKKTKRDKIIPVLSADEIDSGMADLADNDVLPILNNLGGVVLEKIRELVINAKAHKGRFIRLDAGKLERHMRHMVGDQTHGDRLHRTLISLCALPDKLDSIGRLSNLRTAETSRGKRLFWKALTNEQIVYFIETVEKGKSDEEIDPKLIDALKQVLLRTDDSVLIVPAHLEIAIRSVWAAKNPPMDQMCDIDRIIYELRRSYNDLVLQGDHRDQKLLFGTLEEKAKEAKVMIRAVATGDYSEWDALIDSIKTNDIKLLIYSGINDVDYLENIIFRADFVKEQSHKLFVEKREGFSNSDADWAIRLITATEEYMDAKFRAMVKIPGCNITLDSYIPFFGGIIKGKRPY